MIFETRQKFVKNRETFSSLQLKYVSLGFLSGWAVYLYKIEPYTGLLMYHLIPSVILIVSNCIILYKLRFARLARGNMTTGKSWDVCALKYYFFKLSSSAQVQGGKHYFNEQQDRQWELRNVQHQTFSPKYNTIEKRCDIFSVERRLRRCTNSWPLVCWVSDLTINYDILTSFTLNSGTHDNESRKLTIMLVFTGIFYIVCVTPGAIFIAAKDVWNGGNTAYTFSSGKGAVNLQA